MSTVTGQDGRQGERPDTPVPPGRTGRPVLDLDVVIAVVAIVAPVLTALALIPFRDRLDTADNALFLVVVIVAVAGSGRRTAALLCAVASALSFDYFLTRPFYSFRISLHQDLITEILLLVVGITVGELAARGRSHLKEASDSRETVALLHSVTELAAAGREPREVIRSALVELQQLLSLRDGYFTRRDPGALGARITPRGTLTVAGRSWTTEDLGLPTSRVDLPVRAQGWLLGHFVLTPTPGKPVSGQHLIAAVAVADMVGAVLLADDAGLGTDRREPQDPGSARAGESPEGQAD